MRLMLCKPCVLSFPEMSLAPCDMVKRSGTGSLSRRIVKVGTNMKSRERHETDQGEACCYSMLLPGRLS